jgi:uncharacterized protein YllA (UPF0747 family)
MAARKKARTVRKPVRRSTKQAITRLETELPRTLAEFSRRVHRELTSLERRVEQAAAPTRREIARALREVSHALGRYEAEGEVQWRRLTGQARREAIAVLRRIEKALAPPRRRPAANGRRRAA